MTSHVAASLLVPKRLPVSCPPYSTSQHVPGPPLILTTSPVDTVPKRPTEPCRNDEPIHFASLRQSIPIRYDKSKRTFPTPSDVSSQAGTIRYDKPTRDPPIQVTFRSIPILAPESSHALVRRRNQHADRPAFQHPPSRDMDPLQAFTENVFRQAKENSLTS